MHYFFDSSALAKLYHPEAGSERVARIFGEPGRLAFVARISMIELISVAGIKQRTGSLTAAGAAVFLRQVTVSAVMGDFVIQQMHADDYETAARLLSVYSPHHDLRTLDSLHLACALRLRARRGVDFFVTADRVLANVANLEGFAIIIPDEA